MAGAGEAVGPDDRVEGTGCADGCVEGTGEGADGDNATGEELAGATFGASGGGDVSRGVHAMTVSRAQAPRTRGLRMRGIMPVFDPLGPFLSSEVSFAHGTLLRMKIAGCLALLALAACSKGSFEGEITMKTTSATAPANEILVKTNGDNLRFERNGVGEKSHGLFDPATSKVLFFLDAQKVYMEMDFSKPTATPNTNPDTATASKTGKTDTVAGYECELWSAQDASGKRSEVCIAKGIAYFDVGSLRPGGQGAVSPMAKEFRDSKSFPLRSVEYDKDGKELTRMEVTKIEKKKLEPATFAMPTDYKKIDAPAR